MKILPAPENHTRSVRLLVCLSACWVITVTGFILAKDDPYFFIVFFVELWLLLAALPVVALLGLVWAISAKSDRA